VSTHKRREIFYNFYLRETAQQECRFMPDKPTGRSRKTAKKPTKQPIPIDTPIASSQTGTTPQPRPDNTPVIQAYPSTPSRATTARAGDAGIEDEIRLRAYELYEERGRQDGFQDEDWTRAETEILARHQREKSA